jgi:hypothetical protein
MLEEASISFAPGRERGLSLPETPPYPPCRPRIGGGRESRVTHVPIDVAHVVNGLAHRGERVVEREGDGLGEAVDVRARLDVVTWRER